LQAKKQKKGIMRVGDNVLISPDVTHKSDWQIASEIFFDKAYLFKPAS